MKYSLHLGQTYKSYAAPFEWSNIPEFVVLTGENGAGKTQLLEMIHASVFQISGPGPGILSGESIDQWAIAYFNQSFRFPRAAAPIGQSDVLSLNETIAGQIKNNGSINSPPYTEYINRTFREKIADPASLSVEQIAERLPFNFAFPQSIDSSGFFDNITQAVGLMCMRFVLREASEAHSAMVDGRAISLSEVRVCIGEEPPWDEINKLLKLTGFRYSLLAPSKPNETRYALRFQADSGLPIDINNLSGGEQSILGLVLLFYTLRKDGVKLKLLLLDEPDAHLHSSLIGVFLRLMESVVVAEFGCRVIMTTHRLETIVQAPERSLCMLRRTPRVVESTTARAATSALTSSLILAQRASLSVLVEDEDDERFYKTVFDSIVLLGAWNSEHRIEFRSVAKTNVGREDGGGVNLVKSKVEVIQKIVNAFDSITPYRFLFGLIDRDVGNQESSGVCVLSRHSIENYLFDPLVIYCQLLSFGDAPKVSGVRSFGPGDFAKVRELSASEKQRLVDFVLVEIESQWAVEVVSGIDKLGANELERVDVIYIDESTKENKLRVPKWLIDRRGHDLQKVLNKIYKGRMNAGALRKVFGELRVIPKDLVSIFESFATMSQAA